MFGLGLGINKQSFVPNVIVPSGPNYADDFIAAASIVDATEIAALEQLELDLLGTGSTTNNTDVMSKLIAFYPVSPTSLAAAAYNFVDPTTYQITWYNSPTHSATGIQGDRATAYGDTGLDYSILSNADCGLVSRGTMTGADSSIGATNGGVNGFYLRELTGTGYIAGTFTNRAETATKVSPELYIGTSRADNDREVFMNGVSSATNTASDPSTFSSGINITLLAVNQNGTLNYHQGTLDISTWAITLGLTTNEAIDLTDAIETYNANVISGGR